MDVKNNFCVRDKWSGSVIIIRIIFVSQVFRVTDISLVHGTLSCRINVVHLLYCFCDKKHCAASRFGTNIIKIAIVR